jgi:NADH:ubiquinone oxidoreductase subunit 5 (subunit L)/multisubunit Na+/H+ antiporter MnhA subunit
MVANRNESSYLTMLLPALLAVVGLAFFSTSPSVDWSYLIFVVPFLAFPLIAVLGQVYNGRRWWKVGLKEGGIIALSALLVALAVTIWLIGDYLSGALLFKGQEDNLLTWVTFDVLIQTEAGWSLDQSGCLPQDSFCFAGLTMGIWVDSITLMLLFVATFLCFLICWFSIGYMNTDSINEDRNHRFYAEFLLFSVGMFGMVLADNFLWLFIFWEVMGLCSYLLIGFYYWKPSAAAAAKKAFLTTRVGDVFLMLGLFILYRVYGSLSFEVIFDDPSTGIGGALVDVALLRFALLMMFIGAVGKSAQFPLHVWLPDAMEGPTPVSALIHAATMVNAGLYLVARMVPFFDVANGGMAGLADLAILIAWIGGITAFMAALIAFVQNDIKKVLAYSTMSQLAYIFTGLGAALWFLTMGADDEMHTIGLIVLGASLFHLFNHAMAKGMLFMASGSVIHEMHHAHHHAHDHGDIRIAPPPEGAPEALDNLIDYLKVHGLTARSFFQLMDLDSSRTLTVEEISNAFRACEITDVDSWDVEATVSAMDLNGDGEIDPDEFDKFLMDYLIAGRVGTAVPDDDFDPQDMRGMGGLAGRMPVTAIAMMLGSMSIIGIPLIGGFWSKEGIVGGVWEAVFAGGSMMAVPAILVLLTAGMTGFYMSRMWLMTFAGKHKSEYAGHVVEQTPWIRTPLVVLSVMTGLGGILLAMLGVGTFLAENGHLGFLDHHGHAINPFESLIGVLKHAFMPDHLEVAIVTYATILLSLVIGPFVAARLHGGELPATAKAHWLVAWLPKLSSKAGHSEIGDLAESGFADALHRRLYFDEAYEWLIDRTVMPFAAFAAWFDKNIIDGVVKLIERGSVSGSKRIRLLTTGNARDYILMTAVGALCIVLLLLGVA